jgi:nicotinamide-nucleotide amidase
MARALNAERRASLRRAGGVQGAFITERPMDANPDTPSDADLRRDAAAVAELLLARGLMLVTAESCTGGWIAKTLTDLPGSSTWFEAGVVAYSYEAKEALLGVNPRTLERSGAVSEETVMEMVSGALARFGAGVAVAVTGIAGPGGGTPDKPVGSVWIGWKRRGGYAQARLFHFAGDREAVRRQTVAESLAGIRKILT